MKNIISKIYKLLNSTSNLIEFEEQSQTLMYSVFCQYVGEVFTTLDHLIKGKKQAEGWTVKHTDPKSIQFTFGTVRFDHTLMWDKKKKPHHPLDEWLGFRKYQRYSPLVEVKVAELASEMTYRATAETLEEWTPVSLTHQSVGTIVKRVGKTQAEADKEHVEDLEMSASLPEGKKVEYLFAEADGVFIRGLKKKQSMEVHHAVIYGGWEKNGKRVSLRQPKVVMTTGNIQKFWDEVQTLTANTYSLEKTQVVTNSDGGQGYTAERFQTAFSQSERPVLNQLDSYHVSQRSFEHLGAEKAR